MTKAMIRSQVYQVSQSFFLFLLGILGVSTQAAIMGLYVLERFLSIFIRDFGSFHPGSNHGAMGLYFFLKIVHALMEWPPLPCDKTVVVNYE
jgi:hypothetical protein